MMEKFLSWTYQIAIVVGVTWLLFREFEKLRHPKKPKKSKKDDKQN